MKTAFSACDDYAVEAFLVLREKKASVRSRSAKAQGSSPAASGCAKYISEAILFAVYFIKTPLIQLHPLHITLTLSFCFE